MSIRRPASGISTMERTIREIQPAKVKATVDEQTQEHPGPALESPFQKEMAVANLAFAALGILSIWVRGGFWTATIVGFCILLSGCGLVHLRDLAGRGNRGHR